MGILKTGRLDVVVNPRPARAEAYAGSGRIEILSLAALSTAEREITAWPGYAATRLIELEGLAKAAGASRIFYKDEGARFGLGSFKALGGAYAVLRALLKAGASFLTVTCATDGNHGRSVAWGARTFGCKCVIYVHAAVSRNRRDAISAYGAEVREVAGTYDDAVRKAAEDARINGWTVVSDTSYEGYTDTPRDVMQGYGLIALEVERQLPPGASPTHVFVQAGVGGLAASLCAYYWERFGDKAPVFAVAEPVKANCLQLSAKSGKPAAAHGNLDTIMAGLACGEPSPLAWTILSAGADAFLTLDDDAAAETMRLLADTPYGDAPIVAGESAVAGLAAFLLAAADDDARRRLRLTADSVVLIIGTEGATDPDLYRTIVGRSAQEVSAAKNASGAFK